MTRDLAAAPLRAYGLMAAGACGLTLGDFCIKKAALSGVSVSTLLLFAWPLTAFGLLVLAHVSGGMRHHFAPRYPGKLAMRTLLLLIMAYLNVTSLSLNPYSQHVMLFQLSPVFALLIGVVFLGERLTLLVVLVLGVCILGAWLIINPASGGYSVFLLIALAAALSNATTNAYVAANRHYATAIGFTFYAVNGVAMVAALHWATQVQDIPALSSQVWIQASAVFSVLGIILVGMGMQAANGNVGRVSTMFYVQMPMAVCLGWIAFGETPSLSATLGGVIVILAGATIMLFGRTGQRR